LRPFIKRYRDLGLRIPAVIVDVKEYDEVPPRQNYFTVEQIEKALQFANPTQWLLIKIKFDAGLRISELTNLRLQQISDRRLDYKGKGRKKSHSFMSPATRERLDEYIRYNKIKDYLWENRNTGKPYSVNYIRDLMGEPFQHAGIEGFYPHSLRHSFATDFRRHGASIEEVSKALNHSNVAITETYVHELEKHKEKMFDKYKFGILDEQEKFSPDNDPAAAFAKSLFQQLFERSGVAVR
jgi:integrase